MALEDFLSGLPIVGGLFDDSAEQEQQQLQRILSDYENLSTPDVSWENYSPEAYEYGYNPEEYKAQLLKEDPRLIQSQRDYLQQLQGLSNNGLSEADKASYELARQTASSEAQSQRDAMARSAMASGTYGGGLDFVSRQAANQAAADRTQRASLQQAADSARQRALYTQAYGGELGNQRSQDFNTEQANKNILNQFNQLNVGERNNAARARDAVSRENVANRNAAQQYNIEGRQGANQLSYQNELSRLAGVNNARGGMANAYGARGAARKQTRGAVGTALGAAAGYGFGGDLDSAKLGAMFGGGAGGF
jgi:hypothetical protein